MLTLFGFQLSPLVLQMSDVSRSKRVVLCGRPNIAGNDSAALRSFHRKLCFHEKILQKRMMCEVREAESTSGGVSRRVDVVGSSGADFDHIGKGLGEGGDKKDGNSN